MNMRIGEVAKRTGVSVDALRFYEEKGLIKSQRSAKGYRWYATQTVDLVGYIKLAQQLGFPWRKWARICPCCGTISRRPPSCWPGFLLKR